jgi:LacI family transcriptional regulator
VTAVAKAAGVSIATASRVLNSSSTVNADMRSRVFEAAAKLGYIPNSAAKALRIKRTRLVGAVIPTLDHAFFARMVDAFQETVTASGYTVLIITVGFDSSRIFEPVRSLIERGAEALMLVGRIDDEPLQRFIREREIVAVSTYSIVPDAPIPSIGFDNYKAIRQVVDYLLRLGHKRLAMIAGPTKGNDRQQARVKAFLDARNEHRIRHSWHVVERSYLDALDEGASALREIHTRHPEVTAIVCNSDSLAFGALAECKRLALDVPGHFSIVGHDDQDFAARLDPPLTTIAVPARQMGAIAARQLVGYLERGEPTRTVCLDAEFQVRATAGKPRRDL